MKPRNRSLYYTFQTNFAFYYVRRCPLPSVGSRKQKNVPPYESAGSVETTKEQIFQHSSSSCTVAVTCLEFSAAESDINGADVAVLVNMV